MLPILFAMLGIRPDHFYGTFRMGDAKQTSAIDCVGG